LSDGARFTGEATVEVARSAAAVMAVPNNIMEDVIECIGSLWVLMVKSLLPFDEC